MGTLELVTPAPIRPVTLVQAKQHLNVNFADHDQLIDLAIRAATSYVERWLGRSLVETVWDYFVDEFPDNGFAIKLPMPPLIEVLEFVSPIGGSAFAGYQVDTSRTPARIYVPSGGSWPIMTETANAARIRYRAGYTYSDDSPADPNDFVGEVPADILYAILLYVGNLYRDRETSVIGLSTAELPWSAKELLRPYRVETSIA